MPRCQLGRAHAHERSSKRAAPLVAQLVRSTLAEHTLVSTGYSRRSLAWYENNTMGRPKQAQVKEVFQVRLPEDRRRALQEEAATRETTPSDVIRMHLERYSEVAWRDLPKLSDNAWCAVFEAVGSVPVDVAAVAWIGPTVARAAEETELGRKWKADAGELASAARAWTFGQACAVADAAVRFHRVLAAKGANAIAAARQATTRPAAVVLEAPVRRERSTVRRTRR
jgi:hypothetical protein